MTKIYAGEYELDDGELDSNIIGDIIKNHNTDFVTIGGMKYQPTKNDKELTFRLFMQKYNIDLVVISEHGIIHQCKDCLKSDTYFSRPWSPTCKPCHAKYMQNWRAQNKKQINSNSNCFVCPKEFDMLEQQVSRILELEAHRASKIIELETKFINLIKQLNF